MSESSKAQAAAKVETLVEFYEKEFGDVDRDADDYEEMTWNDVALDVQTTKLFSVMLCWGGPAVRMVFEVGDDGMLISTPKIQHQDWFEPWTDYPVEAAHEGALDALAEDLAEILDIR